MSDDSDFPGDQEYMPPAEEADDDEWEDDDEEVDPDYHAEFEGDDDEDDEDVDRDDDGEDDDEEMAGAVDEGRQQLRDIIIEAQRLAADQTAAAERTGVETALQRLLPVAGRQQRGDLTQILLDLDGTGDVTVFENRVRIIHRADELRQLDDDVATGLNDDEELGSKKARYSFDPGFSEQTRLLDRFVAKHRPRPYDFMQRQRYGEFGHSEWRGRRTPQSLSQRLLWRRLQPQGMRMSMLAKQFMPSEAGTLAKFVPSAVYGGQFSKSGRLYYSYSQDLKVRLYDTTDVSQPKPVAVFGNPNSGEWTITDAMINHSERIVAYATRSSRVTLCHIDTQSKSQVIINPEARNGSHAAAAPGRRQVRSFPIYSLRFSPDDRVLYAGTGDNSVYGVDLETQQCVTRIRRHRDEVNSICLGDESGNLIYSGSDDTVVRLWDIRVHSSVRPCGSFLGHTEGITSVEARAGDGRYVLTNSKDQTMKLWDVRMLHRQPERKSPLYGDYRTGYDYRFENYRGASGVQHPNDGSLVTYRGHVVHRTLIRSHFSPINTTDQQFVYSGSANGKVFIWKIDGTLVRVLDPDQSIRPESEAALQEPSPDTDPDAGPASNRRMTVHCIRDLSWHPDQPVIYASAWTSVRGGWDYRDYSDAAGGAVLVIPYNREVVNLDRWATPTPSRPEQYDAMSAVSQVPGYDFD